MDNDRRFEITGKIVTPEQIIEVSEYLQKTKDFYVNAIKADKEKNNDVYFDKGSYKYYAYTQPKVEYDISYKDGRSVKTQDTYVFNDALKEPQYLKTINMQIYISYKDNIMGEVTDHNESLYLTFREDSIFFQTSDKNMSDESYNLNSYVRGIIEKGNDHYDNIAKNRYLIRNIIGFAFGSVFAFIMFFVLLYLKTQEIELAVTLFDNSIILVLIGWLFSFAVGRLLSTPILNNLFHEIDSSLNGYSKESTKNKKERYKEANEVLIGENYNNLEKRELIKKVFSISKIITLIHVVFSIIVLIFLNI